MAETVAFLILAVWWASPEPPACHLAASNRQVRRVAFQRGVEPIAQRGDLLGHKQHAAVSLPSTACAATNAVPRGQLPKSRIASATRQPIAVRIARVEIA